MLGLKDALARSYREWMKRPASPQRELALSLVERSWKGERVDAESVALLNEPDLIDLKVILAAIRLDYDILRTCIAQRETQSPIAPDTAMLLFDAALSRAEPALAEQLLASVSTHAPQRDFASQLLAAAFDLLRTHPPYAPDAGLDPGLSEVFRDIRDRTRHEVYVLCRFVQWHPCATMPDIRESYDWLKLTGLPYEPKRLLLSVPGSAQPAEIFDLAKQLVHSTKAQPLIPIVRKMGRKLDDSDWLTLCRFAHASADSSIVEAAGPNSLVSSYWGAGEAKQPDVFASRTVATRARRSPKIAICVSGQMRNFEGPAEFIEKEFSGLDADIFVSTWSRRGVRGAHALQHAQLKRLLPASFLDAVPISWLDRDGLVRAVPEIARLFSEAEDGPIDAPVVQATYRAKAMDIEDDDEFLERFAGTIDQPYNKWRMYYKIRRCFELAKLYSKANNVDYDLFVRVRPDYYLKKEDVVRWHDLDDDQVAADGVYWYGAGDQLAIATKGAMDRFTSVWLKREKYIGEAKRQLFAGAPFLHFMETHKLLATHCWLEGLRVQSVGADSSRLPAQPIDRASLAATVLNISSRPIPDPLLDWARSTISGLPPQTERASGGRPPIPSMVDENGERQCRAPGRGGRPDLLRTELSELHGWMTQALDLWSNAGLDAAKGRFHEALGLDGGPVERPARRLFVQARQIATFSRACLEGACGAPDLPARAFEVMKRDYLMGSGLWAQAVDVRGTHRGIPDLYGHAFVLFAIGWLFRLTGNPRLVSLAKETLHGIMKHFSLEVGFAAHARRNPAALEQNPHMHLLEAMLVLGEFTGDETFLDIAAGIVRLLKDKLVCPSTGLVRERFGSEWRHELPPALTLVEPGHQFEWAYLLFEYQRLADFRAADLIAPLITGAASAGCSVKTGLVMESVTAQGTPVAAGARLWAQAEAVRALWLVDCPQLLSRPPLLSKIIGSTIRYHLDGAIRGGYIDAVDSFGQALSQWMPASALYHLVGACLSCGFHLAPAPRSVDDPLRPSARADKGKGRRSAESSPAGVDR